MAKARTLYDKIWDDHVVEVQPDGTTLLYIDRHLVHEVTSPQAFEGLRMSGRKVRAPPPRRQLWRSAARVLLFSSGSPPASPSKKVCTDHSTPSPAERAATSKATRGKSSSAKNPFPE